MVRRRGASRWHEAERSLCGASPPDRDRARWHVDHRCGGVVPPTYAYYYILVQRELWNRASIYYLELGRYSSDEQRIMRSAHQVGQADRHRRVDRQLEGHAAVHPLSRHAATIAAEERFELFRHRPGRTSSGSAASTIAVGPRHRLLHRFGNGTGSRVPRRRHHLVEREVHAIRSSVMENWRRHVAIRDRTNAASHEGEADVPMKTPTTPPT